MKTYSKPTALHPALNILLNSCKMAHTATLSSNAAVSRQLLEEQLNDVAGTMTPQLHTAERDQTGIEG